MLALLQGGEAVLNRQEASTWRLLRSASAMSTAQRAPLPGSVSRGLPSMNVSVQGPLTAELRALAKATAIAAIDEAFDKAGSRSHRSGALIDSRLG